MKKSILAITAAAALVLASFGAVSADPDDPRFCNWGQLTSEQIAAGFPQGEHSSSYAGEPRDGLANVVEQGNLNRTCWLITRLLNGGGGPKG